MAATGKAQGRKLSFGDGVPDLAGKSVMPTLISTHVHPGFQKGVTYVAENYTRGTVLTDLNRALYFGISVVQSQGIERGDVLYRIRTEQAAGMLGVRERGRAGRVQVVDRDVLKVPSPDQRVDQGVRGRRRSVEKDPHPARDPRHGLIGRHRAGRPCSLHGLHSISAGHMDDAPLLVAERREEAI